MLSDCGGRFNDTERGFIVTVRRPCTSRRSKLNAVFTQGFAAV